MKELSIFIDESGDFGEYLPHAPYYIISMVMHDQQYPIDGIVNKLNDELNILGLPKQYVHCGPIIRKQEDYANMSISDRRRILNKMVAFIRQCPIKYASFYIEKTHINDSMVAIGKLAKQIASFIKENYNYFLSFDSVKVYYDNGQTEVTKILSSVFNTLLSNVIFRKVVPSDYKLFQVADVICTFKLLKLKLEKNTLTKSELKFFGNVNSLKKNYLKKISSKAF